MPDVSLRRVRETSAQLRRLAERTPLRVRLVVALLALVAVALALTGVTATTQLRGYLVTQVDRDLTDGPPPRARTLQEGLPDDGQFHRSRAEWAGYALQSSGRLLVSGGTDASSPPALSSRDVLDAGNEPFTVPSKGHGSDWRVLVTATNAVQSGTGAPVVMVRAISLSDVDDTVGRLVLLEVLVGLAVLALLGGAGYVVVRRSLRPLVDVEHTAAAIADGDLSRRVPESDPRTEVGRLSRAFNAMVSQIEAAFGAQRASEAAARASEDKMRRFVADASHELRTPLTSIRGFAELYRQGAASTPEDVARVMRRVEDSAAQMGLLVDDLLLLARLDQQRPLDRRPVDLVALAADVVHDAAAVAPDRTIGLDVDTDEAAVVLGDEPRLRQVLSNLVTNALHHTPDGSPVQVAVVARADEGGYARLAVRDRGPGLAPEDAARIFERFYRTDSSRSRSAGGTGLGLSIVHALVAAHGGQVGVDTAPGAGAVFWVRLPLAPGAAPAALADDDSAQQAAAGPERHDDSAERVDAAPVAETSRLLTGSSQVGDAG